MEETTLIVILTAFFNLLAIVIQKLIDKYKSKDDKRLILSEISEKDSGSIQSLLSAIGQSNDTLQEINRRYVELLETQSELKQKIADLEDSLNEKDDTIEALTKKVDLLSTENDNLNRKMDSLVGENERLTKLVNTLKKQMKDAGLTPVV